FIHDNKMMRLTENKKNMRRTHSQELPEHRVTSEVFVEKDATEVLKIGGNAFSKFFFKYPPHLRKNSKEKAIVEQDEDGDLVLDRNEEGVILIKHSRSTELALVGLQIWRGALLLADYILSFPELFQNKVILELGSGVGFDSIIAAMVAKEVICTDVNVGGILKLIEDNFYRNKELIKSKTCVTELDFMNLNWNAILNEKMKNVDVVMAADVIYDDKITDGFVKTLGKLFDFPNIRQIYVALEKRYVFTIADLDSVAPSYEEFFRSLRRHKLDLAIDEIKLQFPQFFRYQRLSQLVLMKIERKF
ncbi:hypothetical protein QAD02_023686, partial [Eretmocerus hayati]